MTTKQNYKHGEAFCLMWYACEDIPRTNYKACGHRERVWNSRDGVTPFGMSCPSCGRSSMRHVDWEKDEQLPNYKPFIWQRFFRDGTVEDALRIIDNRRRQAKIRGTPMLDVVYRSMVAEAKAQIDEWQPGWPYVDVELPPTYQQAHKGTVQ